MGPGGVNGPGGVGRLVTSSVRCWQAEGMRPKLRVVDPYGSGSMLWMPLLVLRAALQVTAAAWRGRVGLLHLHMAGGASIVRKGILLWVGKWLRVPIILHLHGSRLDERWPRMADWARALLRRTWCAADRVIVVGPYWRDLVTRLVGVDEARVRIVANAVGGPAQVARRPVDGVCRLLFLGQLCPEKGVPELLTALGDASLSGLDWRLQLAGGGDARPYRELATAWGIADRVEFCGLVGEPRVEELLSAADVFVLPSHNEAISMAMLEAMAHGCVVVTTAVGSTLDVVTPEETAVIVPVADAVGLAQALRRVIVDRDLREALQGRARQRFLDQFEIRTHCQKILAVYRELVPEWAD